MKSPSMEIIQINSPDSQNPNADSTPTNHPRRRRRSASTCDGSTAKRQINRVDIIPSCLPAFYALKQELGFRSDADIVHWLLHQSRPQLVPALSPPISPPSRNSASSSSLCMEVRHLDKVASASDPTPRLPVKATVVQASSVFFDTPATLDKAERLIAEAAANGSQLVVFPEAFIGGYPLYSIKSYSDYQQKYRASAIDVPGPEIDRLAELAHKYKVHLVMGVVEKTASSLFSTLAFFSSNGILGKRRKLMLMPSETAIWRSGRNLRSPIFHTSIGNIGGLLSWDNKSPYLRSELYADGVEIYCAPSNDARDVWKSSAIHVAVEGCCFVLSAKQFYRREDYPNDVSVEEIACSGGSLIISPLGNVLAGPNYQGECQLTVDLDLQEIEQAKTAFGMIPVSLEPRHEFSTVGEDNQSLISVEIKEVPQLLSSDLAA